MRKNDFYRVIVLMAALCAGLFFLAGKATEYWKEERVYGFDIQSQQDLTAEIVEEFRKLSGICGFTPKDTVRVTVSLESYTMEAELYGVEFEREYMPFLVVQQNVMLGNVPKFLIGEEAFSLFTDNNGYAPLKSQIEKWKENFKSLVLLITDEKGMERKGEISGIIKQPDDKIYMDKKQMYEIFGKELHKNGGYMRIYGFQNMKKAKERLEQAGFHVLTE